ncbi:MAG: hypothetical protein KDA99_29640, partial [Planctomycetales bacterium]|nr:hypothetical protein [Planctomycetales bacterium]
LADYAAPEMDRPGQCPNDLTDIYGLGCVLYRLLAGDVPFAGGGVTEKRRRHAGEPIQPLDRLVGIPPSLARLVATMMAKNPGVRVNSARHIAEQLTPLAGESSRKPVSVVALTKDAYLAFLAAPKNPPSPQSTAPQSTAPQSTAPQSTASGQSANADSGVGEMVVAPSVVSTRVAPTKTNRRQTTRLIVGATVVAAIVVGTLLVVMRPDVQPAHGPDSDSDPIAAGQGSHDGADSSGRNSVPSATADATVNAGWVPDDGQSLWRSPTAGRAIVLRYVPRGGQAFAVLRLHQMLEDSEGERMLRAFGPDFLRLVAEWQSAAGVTLDELECLTMVFLPRDNQLPELYFVAQLPSPTDLLQRWEEPAAVTLGSCNAYHRNGWTLSVPADSDGSVFVMGSDDTVREAMELRGAAPPLRRELEQLRMSTDDQRLVNVLLAPNFLFSDGGRLLQGPYAQLLPPLKNLFGDHTRGAAVGLHFDQGRELYLELRMDGAIDEPPTQLSHALEEYLRRLPVDVESFLVSRGAIDPYWQELALKFDNMVEFVCRNVRVGVEGREVVANVSLPKAAGHNLVLGTELALASHRSASIAEQPVTPPPSLRIEEILQTNVTLSFPQQSLEF